MFLFESRMSTLVNDSQRVSLHVYIRVFSSAGRASGNIYRRKTKVRILDDPVAFIRKPSYNKIYQQKRHPNRMSFLFNDDDRNDNQHVL